MSVDNGFRARYASVLMDLMEKQSGPLDPDLMRRCETALFGAPLLAPEPVEASFGWRWTAASGRWHVSLNRRGDVYVSDSRVPAGERAEFLVVLHAAHAWAGKLTSEDEPDGQQESADPTPVEASR